MTEKIVDSRVQQKNDTEARWNLVPDFIPKNGEIIIYNADENNSFPRMKVGDGTTTISMLPFSPDGVLTVDITDADQGAANLINADSLGGVVSSDYMLKTETAADTAKAYGYTLDALKSYMLDLAHPIGSFYWSKGATNPTDLFGGTWEQIKDTFILAAGDSYTIGETGGEAEHTLTVDETPSHWHQLKRPKWYYGDSDTASDSGTIYGTTSTTTPTYYGTESDMLAVGGDQPHNNMPPYLVAYCWCRTA